MTAIPPLPSSTSASAFRPRNGAILTTGILFGIIGLMLGGSGAMTMVQTLMMSQLAKTDPKAMSEFGGMQDMMWTASIVNLVIYGGLGLLFIAVAYGCFAGRRWSRPFALTLAWGWIYMGVTMFLSLAVMMGGMRDMMSGIMESAAKTSPQAPPMPAMDGFFTIIMVIYFVMIVLFMIVLPAVIVWLQWGAEVRLTLESRDPVPRWTDRQPAPLLGMAIAAALFGLCSLPYLFMMGSSFLKPFLPEGPLKHFWIVVPFVWAYIAWGSYRRQLAAWILALGLLAAGTWIGVHTIQRIDWADAFSQMGIPGMEPGDLAKWMESLFQPTRMLVMMVGSILPLLGYLIWVLRYFRRVGS